MRGMFDEHGNLKHPYVVWSGYFDENEGLKYRQSFESFDDWLPCDAYVIFTFTKEDGENRWKGRITKAGDEITAENISYEMLYDKSFINLMLAAAEYCGKNDEGYAGVLKQRLGFVNVPENATPYGHNENDEEGRYE